MKQTKERALSLRKTVRTAVVTFALAIATAATAAFTGGGLPVSAYNDAGLSQVRVNVSVDPTLGAVSEGCNVKLTANGTGAEGASIYYTLDGTDPTTASTAYNAEAGVEVTAEQSGYVTLKAIAEKDGVTSDVWTYHYEILKSLAVGKFSALVNPIQNPATAGGPANAWLWSGQGLTDAQFGELVLNGKLKSYDQTMQYTNNANNIDASTNQHTDLTTYVQIDLGKVETFNRFRFQTSSFGGTAYVADILDVLVSEDGETYTPVSYGEIGTPKGLDPSFSATLGDYDQYGCYDKTFDAVQARYVRVSSVGRDTPAWNYCGKAKMSAFMLYNCDYDAPEAFDPAKPISAGKTFSLVDGVLWKAASPEESYIVSNSSGLAVDINEWYKRLGAADLTPGATVASFKNNADRSTYVQLDLGKEYLVNRINVHTDPITPASSEGITDLKLAISADGETWTTVYEKAGLTEFNRRREEGNSGLYGEPYFKWFESVISSQKARYLRVWAGTANKDQMLTNLLVYGYPADMTGSWEKPEDITASYDRILRASKVLEELNEKYPSATFTATNGVMDNAPVTWEGAEEYTDEALAAGGTFTYYGVPAFGSHGNVNNNYNVAVVAKVTLSRPSVKAITDLLTTIDAANPVQAEYFSASWTAYATARTAAETVRDNVYATAAEIADAASALESAYKGLEKLGDTAELKAYINTVKDTPASGYIAGSFAAFTQALENANTVANAAEVSQKQVDDAKAALKAAYEGLIAVSAAEPLKAAIAQAKAAAPAADENKYVAATWAVYAQKLAAAESAVTQATAQAQLDTAKTELEEAVTALVRLGDKTALNATIETAKAVDKTKYTTASVAKLEDALEAAEAVKANAQASQSEVDTANTALDGAVKGLVALGDATQLKAAIANYGDGSKYTSDSWSEFLSVLDNVKHVAESSAPTAKEVEDATEELAEAAKKLVLRGDKTELNALLKKTFSESEYTKLSIAAYNKVKTGAQAVANDIDATKTEVDEAVVKLKDAESKLVKLGDKTALNALITECEGLKEGKYSEESLNKLVSEIDYAKSVVSDSQATQADIDGAVTRLTEAKEALVQKGGCAGSLAASSAIASLALVCACAVVLVKKGKKNV